MKTIVSLTALLCLVFCQTFAQTKPQQRIEINPDEEFKFFRSDSLKKFPDSLHKKYFRPFRPFKREQKMPEYTANPDIDYKMKIFRPDSTIDYKILRKRY